MTSAGKLIKNNEIIEKQQLLWTRRKKELRFLSSPNKIIIEIEVINTMNPAFLLGTAFNIAYCIRKYHSGTICNGVRSSQAGCSKWKKRERCKRT